MNRKSNHDPVLAELIAIKKLLVFQLLAAGATQKQVGSVLGVDQAQISRMLPGVTARVKGASKVK